MQTATEVLIEARRLIAEVGWTQGAFARDAYGHNGGIVTFHSRGFTPVCYCADGAIDFAGDGFPTARHDAGYALRNAIDNKSLWEWNDTPGRTVEEVLAAFDRAIALSLAEKGERS